MKMSRGKKFFLIVGLWFLVSAVFSLYLWEAYHPQEKEFQTTVAVRNEVERAIKVSSLNNETVYTGEINVTGAGLFFYMQVQAQIPGVGMGAPTVAAKNVEQFLYLVPPTERIYVALGQGRRSDASLDPFAVKKAYWAFIENRAGIVVWEDAHSYYSYETKSWWKVSGFNENEVKFSSGIVFENDWVYGVYAIIFIVWFIAAIISFFILLP